MQPDQMTNFFTRSDGTYAFARWGRPIVPVVFGVDGPTLGVVKGAIEAVVALAGHKMAETDPELGANLMVFFFRDWAELKDLPNLDQLIPDLGPLVDRLSASGANQYRLFRFDPQGGDPRVFRLFADGCRAFGATGRVDSAGAGGADDPVLVGPRLCDFLAAGAGQGGDSPQTGNRRCHSGCL